jgi:hypothetical protein
MKLRQGFALTGESGAADKMVQMPSAALKAL